MKSEAKPNPYEFDLESMKHFIELSPAEKLTYLEQLNDFVQKVMPEKSKKWWKKLRTSGF